MTDAPLCLPPRPLRSRTGGRPLPDGTCDSHMHVFGPEDLYPLAVLRSYTPQPLTLADYRPVMDALGIDRAVLVQPSVYGTDNAALLDALRQMPNHLRGVVVVAPDVPDAELDALHAAGVRGIRINRRNPGGLRMEDVEGLARRIAPRGWHIQLQVELDQGPDLAGLATSCPVPLVLDHFGFLDPRVGLAGADFTTLLRLLDHGAFWLKLSAPYRLGVGGHPYATLLPFVDRLLAHRPDRLLWATDWPHTELWADVPDDFELADALRIRDMSEGLRRQVLVDNPASLYGFAP